MEGIYAIEQVKIIDGSRIRAVIVPHHLVSSEAMALGIKSLQNQGVEKIILISPDHFEACPNLACSSNLLYETFFGQVATEEKTLKKLLNSRFVSNEPVLFQNEHGIFAVVPFVAKYLPDVSVTPLVLSQKRGWGDDREVFRNLLSKLVDEKTALVVSSDFSHYLPLEVAERMDEFTWDVLQNGSLDQADALLNPQMTDCSSCLWYLRSLAELKGFFYPEVLLHTNSATILDDETVESTTSHFCIIWRENVL